MNYPVLSGKNMFLQCAADRHGCHEVFGVERDEEEVQGKREGGMEMEGGKWTHPFGSFVVAVTKAIHF